MKRRPRSGSSRYLSSLGRLAHFVSSLVSRSRRASSASNRRNSIILAVYRLHVAHAMTTIGLTGLEALRHVDHRAVIVWERTMREVEGAAPATIRRRLSALSSLFKHLVRHSHAARNPVLEVRRPAVNKEEGTTATFSKSQARLLLDAQPYDTVAGLRDRAILAVGLQVGLRRAEIAALKVGDLHQNRGFDSLRVVHKGGRRDALAINAQTASRLRAYLARAGHAEDHDGPLFRPLGHNGKRDDARRPLAARVDITVQPTSSARRRAADPDAVTA